jgi:hypothetical protein
MSPSTKSESEAAGATPSRSEDFDDVPTSAELEKYGGGHITGHHGRIDLWLLAVYAVLFVWALYYGYTFWGGLGPGLDYSIK